MPLWAKVVKMLEEIDYDTYQNLAKSDDCDEIKSVITKEEVIVLLMKILLDNE